MEIRLPQIGSRVITNPGSEERYWLYQCGASDNSGGNGIKIAMSEKAHSALIEWKLVSDRMAYAVSILRVLQYLGHVMSYLGHQCLYSSSVGR